MDLSTIQKSELQSPNAFRASRSLNFFYGDLSPVSSITLRLLRTTRSGPLRADIWHIEQFNNSDHTSKYTHRSYFALYLLRTKKVRTCSWRHLAHRTLPTVPIMYDTINHILHSSYRDSQSVSTILRRQSTCTYLYLIVAALVPIAPEVKTWFPLSTKAYASSSIIFLRAFATKKNKRDVSIQNPTRRRHYHGETSKQEWIHT